MKKNSFTRSCLLPALMLVLVTGCHKQIKNEVPANDVSAFSAQVKMPDVNEPLPSGSEMARMAPDDMVKALRTATRRFNATTQAIKSGYEPSDHCVSIPGVGGMGYHWVNSTLVDPVFELLRPEAVLYETGEGGNLRLVAVEYIVVNAGQDPPMFGEQPFDVGGTPLPVPHWSLHVWLHKDNPSGIFVPFNPNVSCP